MQVVEDVPRRSKPLYSAGVVDQARLEIGKAVCLAGSLHRRVPVNSQPGHQTALTRTTANAAASPAASTDRPLTSDASQSNSHSSSRNVDHIVLHPPSCGG